MKTVTLRIDDSINEARNEPIANGVTLDKSDW
jgi:hypothetical protein